MPKANKKSINKPRKRKVNREMYICTICGSNFVHRCSLRRHTKEQHGSEPFQYSCPSGCGYGAKRQYDLVRHQEQHCKGNPIIPVQPSTSRKDPATSTPTKPTDNPESSDDTEAYYEPTVTTRDKDLIPPLQTNSTSPEVTKNPNLVDNNNNTTPESNITTVNPQELNLTSINPDPNTSAFTEEMLDSVWSTNPELLQLESTTAEPQQPTLEPQQANHEESEDSNIELGEPIDINPTQTPEFMATTSTRHALTLVHQQGSTATITMTTGPFTTALEIDTNVPSQCIQS